MIVKTVFNGMFFYKLESQVIQTSNDDEVFINLFMNMKSKFNGYNWNKYFDMF